MFGISNAQYCDEGQKALATKPVGPTNQLSRGDRPRNFTMPVLVSPIEVGRLGQPEWV